MTTTTESRYVQTQARYVQALADIADLSKERAERRLFELAETARPDDRREALQRIAREAPATPLGEQIAKLAQDALLGEPEDELSTALSELAGIVDGLPPSPSDSEAVRAARNALKESRKSLESPEDQKAREHRETRRDAAMAEIGKVAAAKPTDPTAERIVKIAQRVARAKERAHETERAEHGKHAKR